MAWLSTALLLGGALALLFAGSASAAAPNWLEPTDLSKPGRDATNPAVAADAAGNTVAIWERQGTAGPGTNLQMATRAPGGTFSTPVDFVLKGTEPQLAMTPGGEAVAAWKHFENPPGINTIQVATRPPGGSFGVPITIYSAKPNVFPGGLQVALGTGGTVAVTWSLIDPDSGLNPNPSFVMASVRPAGGVFTEAKRISAAPAPKPAGEPAQEEWVKEESVKVAGGARPAVDAAGKVTVVWTAFNGTDFVIQTAGQQADQDFTAPAQVSESGEDAGLAEIGVDGAGNAIASWQRNDGSARMVQAAIKPPGGAFAPLGDVSPPGGTAESPVLEVAPDGAATLVWRLGGLAESVLQSSTRPAGGAFSTPVNVSSGKDNPLFYKIAVGDEGDAVVVWSGENGTEEIVRAAVRPPGASFGSPVPISQSSPDFFHPLPAMSAAGDATVVWAHDNGTNNIVQMAGYDADLPQLRDIAIPSTGTVGSPLQFSASAVDAWPVSGPSFDFGDGGMAEGTSVFHAYSAPGSYAVTVTAKDPVGKTATSTGTILVKARNYFTIGKLKKNRKKGTATLTVTVPEPGVLTLTGKRIKRATVRTAKGGTVKIAVRAAGKSVKSLDRKGKLKASLKIAYSPDGGDTSTQRHKVTLQKKLG